MEQVNILVVEDNEDINRILRRYLEQEGYVVTSAFSGTEARLLLKEDMFHLILLDLMIPGITGEELIGEIRTKQQVPILVISAKTSLEDKVRALKIGADDYITKPFEREEVLARIGAILRRSKSFEEKPIAQDYEFKQLILKPSSRTVYINKQLINLTAYEYDILILLLQYPDKVFTKDQLYQDIWKMGYYGEDNTINVHISNIRKKIKEFDDSSYIKTVWGIGFKLDNE